MPYKVSVVLVDGALLESHEAREGKREEKGERKGRVATVPGRPGTDAGPRPPNVEALPGPDRSATSLLLSWGMRFWSDPADLFPFLLDGASRPEVACLLPARVWVGLGLPAGDQGFMDTDLERSQECSPESDRAQFAVGNGILILHPPSWSLERRGRSQAHGCWVGAALNRFRVCGQ